MIYCTTTHAYNYNLINVCMASIHYAVYIGKLLFSTRDIAILYVHVYKITELNSINVTNMEVVEHIEQEDECTHNAWVEAADQLDLEERFEICSTENRAACVYRTP